MTIEEFRKRQGLPVKEAKPQIRIPKKRLPNKTEAGWIARISRKFPPSLFRIRYEPMSLNLPSGTRYTPDVVVTDIKTGIIVCVYEVKGGHIHNSASVRAFKEAAAAFPEWKFGFAQLRKTQWTVSYANGE